jgi:hypothetical protein
VTAGGSYSGGIVGKAGYSSTYEKRYRAIFANITETPLSNKATFSNIYAYSGMTVDGATVTDSDVNGTGITLLQFKSNSSPCFSGWNFASTWIMTEKGPTLGDMPLGAGRHVHLHAMIDGFERKNLR